MSIELNNIRIHLIRYYLVQQIKRSRVLNIRTTLISVTVFAKLVSWASFMLGGKCKLYYVLKHHYYKSARTLQMHTYRFILLNQQQ